jgi:hypothetical protein
VQVESPDAGVAVGLNRASDELSPELPQPGQFERPGIKAGMMAGALAGTTDRGMAVRAALKAGVLGVFVGIIPILGIVLTGTLAVFFYRRESRVVLPARLGARLGGAAGVVAFAINALLITIRVFVFHAQQEYMDAILKVAQKFGSNMADPDIQAGIHNLFTPSGLAITFFFWMMLALVLASLGGALASLLLRPRSPRG